MTTLSYEFKQRVTFTCAFDTRFGAYHLNQNDAVLAVSDGKGKFDLYVKWAEGSLGKYNASQILYMLDGVLDVITFSRWSRWQGSKVPNVKVKKQS
jgi:hypothetical protein